MSTINKLTQEALTLPTEQKVQLVEQLVESLEFSVDEQVKSAWRTEVQRRKAEIVNGKVKLIPDDEALEQVRQIIEP